MTNKEHLIHQHILEYESRQKHLDELYEKAQQAAEHLPDDHEIKQSLHAVGQEKNQLDEQGKVLKTMHVDKWREETIQKAGPMAVWDILAQKLEDLIEKVEK